MDHISIILVHYNTDRETKSCLESLERIESKNFKHSVIIVDNGSKKPLKLSKAYIGDHNIKLIRSESNLGFTGGNNLGIRYALDTHNSEYVLLLNNDTTVAADFLQLLYEKLQQTPQGGLVSPKIYFTRGLEFHKKSYKRNQLGKIIWYAGGSIDWPNLISFHRGVDEVDRGQFDQQTSSDFATGCCVLISREVLEKVGLLEDRYFLYFEDADLSVRATEMGFKVLFCPESRIWHDNAGSSGGSGSRLQRYYQTRNRIYFSLKRGSKKTALTAINFALKQLLGNNGVERQAAFHALTGNMGKQTVI